MIEKVKLPKNEEKIQHSTGSKAAIGESVVIVGDVSGKEDLIINGSIEGEINLRENNIIVGQKGRVNANVVAKNITIEGEVKGELRASEQVIVMPSGRVAGDIRAPRVILNDGCQFKGSVDMDEMHTSVDQRSNKFQLNKNRPPSREHPIKIAKKSVKH